MIRYEGNMSIFKERRNGARSIATRTRATTSIYENNKITMTKKEQKTKQSKHFFKCVQ